MTERPIIFNTEMVKAIMANQKTQTRRLMRPQPLFRTQRRFIFADEECPKKLLDCDDITEYCMYQPGDILWVRETWSKQINPLEKKTDYRHKAGNDFEDSPDERWRPSIHMPREAARLFLRVIDIRVQRLQDIKSAEAEAEGVGKLGQCKWRDYRGVEEEGFMNPVASFIILWDKLYSIKGKGWDANPWVWVIEFERIEQ